MFMHAKRFALLLTLLAAAACSLDRSHVFENREAYTGSTFPDPADRRGIYLVYPYVFYDFNAIMDIFYFPSEVSQAQVIARVERYCSRFSYLAKVSGGVLVRDPPTDTMVPVNGQMRPAKRTLVSCIPWPGGGFTVLRI